jgi:tol-pal system protein YbgF
VARVGARAALALLLVIELVALPARAAIFDDDEARKRIESLRGRVDQIERLLTQRLEALETKNAGVVDLFKDVEQIKADIAKLRGQYEVLTYELEQAQKRQRDLYLDLDTRLRRLETAPAAAGPAVAPDVPPAGTGTLPPATAGPTPGRSVDVAGEQRAYDAALDQFKSGNFAAAASSFQAFTRTYPRSPLAPSALYWAGNAQYAQKDFRAAIATQRQLLGAFPDSQKVPDALLNIASAQIELGDSTAAKRTLEEIVSKYPSSEAAGKARQRLSGR